MTDFTTTPSKGNTMEKVQKYTPHVLTAFTALVFLDSLRFKFTNAPETQVIFGKLNDWAAGFGAEGLFAQTGLFSQYVIGTAELFASLFLILGLFTAFPPPWRDWPGDWSCCDDGCDILPPIYAAWH